MSYIFGEGTGLGYGDIQKRRIARQLPQQKRDGFGEGLNAVLAALDGGTEADKPKPAANPYAAPEGGSAPLSAALGVDMGSKFSGESGLPASLVASESGGNLFAQNDVPGSGGVGHFGRGQFSRGRLADAMRAGVIPEGMSPEAFMADPEAQLAVERWHVSDIMNNVRNSGLDQYVGSTINGIPITPNGMLAVAHLGGFGGLKKYLESGGAYNPADAYGTSLDDYMRRHAGNTVG